MKSFKSMILVGLLGFGFANSHRTDCVKIAGMNFFGEDLASGLFLAGLSAAMIGCAYYSNCKASTAHQTMCDDAQAIKNKLAKIGQDEQTSVQDVNETVTRFHEAHSNKFERAYPEHTVLYRQKTAYDKFNAVWDVFKQQNNVNNGILTAGRQHWDEFCTACDDQTTGYANGKRAAKISTPIIATIAFLLGVFGSRQERINRNYNIWYGNGW